VVLILDVMYEKHQQVEMCHCTILIPQQLLGDPALDGDVTVLWDCTNTKWTGVSFHKQLAD